MNVRTWQNQLIRMKPTLAHTSCRPPHGMEEPIISVGLSQKKRVLVLKRGKAHATTFPAPSISQVCADKFGRFPNRSSCSRPVVFAGAFKPLYLLRRNGLICSEKLSSPLFTARMHSATSSTRVLSPTFSSWSTATDVSGRRASVWALDTQMKNGWLLWQYEWCRNASAPYVSSSDLNRRRAPWLICLLDSVACH